MSGNIIRRPAENIRVANGVLTIEARHETLDPAQFPGLGRAELHVGEDRLEARLDLRLLRNPRQAALRARHLARDLDASPVR